MTHSISFKHHALWSAAALALCCALTSCGGDEDDNGGGGGGGGSGTAGERAVALDAKRIEPLDTAKRTTAKVQENPALPALSADAPVAEIVLPAPVAAKTTLDAPQKGQPLHIGAERALGKRASADEVARLLPWQPLENGGQAAALRLVSPGAAGVRLAVDVRSLPAGAVLRFYGDFEGDVLEVTADEAARLRAINEEAGLAGEEARLVWSHAIDGAAVTLEVELPAGAAPDAAVLAVPHLSHLMLSPLQAITKNIGDSGSCNLNATCVLDDISAESRAVAKMTFNKNGRSYLCTGTLLNDARSSRTPHFITANHCISSQSVASTLSTLWFYRAASCDGAGSAYSGAKQLSGGAALLRTDATYDTTLLRLNRQPPAGAVYAGSYFGGVLGKGSGVLGVHHPSGDLQKYSVGSITGYGTCSGDSCRLSDSDSSRPMFRIGWSQGTTEGGSSGSGLFVRNSASNTRYFAGVLHGGDASCSNQGGFDVYGRFGKAYDAGLQNWLAK